MTMAGQGFKTRSRNYNTFFSLPVASFLLSLLLAPAAFCEENDNKGNSMPLIKLTKQLFFTARTSLAEKEKKMNQAAELNFINTRCFKMNTIKTAD